MQMRLWRSWNPHTLLVGSKMVLLLWKTAWQFLKKLNTELHHHPAIPHLCLIPKRIENRGLNLNIRVHWSVSQKLEATQVSINNR